MMLTSTQNACSSGILLHTHTPSNLHINTQQHGYSTTKLNKHLNNSGTHYSGQEFSAARTNFHLKCLAFSVTLCGVALINWPTGSRDYSTLGRQRTCLQAGNPYVAQPTVSNTEGNIKLIKRLFHGWTCMENHRKKYYKTFNCHYSTTAQVSWYQNVKPFWVLLQHEMMDNWKSKTCLQCNV